MTALERRTPFFLAACVLALACARAPDPARSSTAAPEPVAQTKAPAAPAPAGADTAPATERRLVKKASLEFSVNVPSDAADAATRIIEGEGGFVATSEQKAGAEDGRELPAAVTLVLRVPADHFSRALSALRRLGKGNASENVTTDDVSEEFIDLDARIHNQRELEAQFLEILKRAGKMEDALNVEREIASVRTEIERMQGRRRFLERETDLATITLTLVPTHPLVSVSFRDFGRAVTQAGSDTVNLATLLTTSSIRLFGVLLPIAVFFGAPALVLARWVRRRRKPA